MDSRRRYIRVKSGFNCVLTGYDGRNYEGRLDNITIDGALVRVSQGIQADLKVGEEFDLMFCYGNEDFSIKHPCKVIRCDPAALAINFIK